MKSNSIKISFFFRKAASSFHSIEELFANIQSALPDNIEFENVHLPHHNGIIGRLRNIFFAKKHSSQINHITGDINYISFGLPKKNTVLTVHDIGSALNGNKLKRFIINMFWFKLPFKKVSRILTISDFTKKELVEKYIIPDNKLSVIPNCVSSKFVPVHKEFSGFKPNILVVGTKKNKNLETIIEALKGVKCKLLIIGVLPELIKKNLQNFDFENYFNLSFDEVVAVYQKADMLLFPSLYEGFGMPIIEAQAVGVPVITSNLEPMKSVAGDGAVFVNPKDSNQIRNAVSLLAKNKEFRQLIVEKAKLNVKKYECSNVAKQLLNIYKQIIND
ncbi:MAG: glycosyltransferase family 1 protein [Bacteroidota bacterium]|nr:glycosyltransferase family 1 protein [Bacteroidota bacterium]